MRLPPAIGVGVAVGVAALAMLPLCRSGSKSAGSAAEAANDGATLAARPGGAGGPSGSTDQWIIAAGGALPEFNQVQIEQDVGLVAEVFAPLGGGRILFGAGAESPTVQVFAPDTERDPVLEVLGELFAPRGGRNARYRATTLPVDAEATAETLSSALEDALGASGSPLNVVLAGHGSRGEAPRDNTVDLWGQSSLSVAELAEILDRGRREVRVVATTCYSGGFAEIAFAGADAQAGAPQVRRCGMFATVWDLEAAGCDPNPDRAAQEGYALHFFNALRGRDRDGERLERSLLDLDGDGKISLLEAHTRVAMVSEAADVPTTTSERWLREVVPQQGPSEPFALPETDALVAALRERLRPGGDDAAFVRLQQLENRIEARLRALEDAQVQEEAAYRVAAAAVLARWPVLDDPWHPDFATTLSEARAAIALHLESDTSMAAWRVAQDEVDRLTQDVAELRRQAAWFERLTRAIETRSLAERLHAAGGPAWETYRELLACERTILAAG